LGLTKKLSKKVAGPSGPVVFLDFETRAVRDLLKVGAYKYTLCPEFDVLCLSYAMNDEEAKNCDGPKFADVDWEFDMWLDELNDLAKNPNVTFEAHYVGFEFWVWHNYMVPKYGFAPIPIERWRCSAAAAAAQGFPRSLFGLCKAIGSKVQKDMEGKKLMLKMCKPLPVKQQEKNGGKWFWNHEAQERLKEYCGQDVESERSAGKQIPPLTPFEQEVWVEDQKLNQRGVTIDMGLANRGFAMVDELKIKWAADCKSEFGFNPTQVGEVKKWMEAHGVTIPLVKNQKGEMTKSMGAKFLDKLMIETKDPQVKSVIKYRKDAGSPSLAKYKNCIEMSVDGVCRDQFIMNGANTGRWSSKGVQFHNFPRGTLLEDHEEDDMEMIVAAIKKGDSDQLQWAGSEMEGMKTAMRGLIIAPPGKRLYVMDYSQIEARIMAWLAEQDHILQYFIDGKDLYKVTAALMFNIPYEEVTKAQRFLGKVGSLSLQYQGGEDAFMGMATNYGQIIPRKEAKRIKNLWREANPEIKSLWSEYQWAAIQAIERGGTRAVGRIKFRKQGDFLKCMLPSGRCLHYYKPEVQTVTIHPKPEQDFDSFETKQMTYIGADSAKGIVWDRVSIYGGRWAENICQAIGADILRIPMVEIPKRKKWRCMFDLECIFHTHDELGALGPDDEHWKQRLAEMQHVMLEVPDCYDGLPMAAEGFSGYRYRKD